jgi:DNA invertase Pin-like site-specific DNA recombinase
MSQDLIRAAIYVRLSHDPEGTQLAIDRQEQACRTLAGLRGWTVVEVYRDNDLSAYTGKRRPGFEAMLTAIRDGEVQAVVSWHQDRVCRRVKELSVLLETMKEARCRWATVNGGDIDPNTATGEMMATIIGAVAQQESAHKSERLKARYEQDAERGKPGGRSRAYGYADGQRIAIVGAEAENICEAARRVLAGEGVLTVVRDWKRRGIPSTTGGKWTVTTLRRVLMSPELSGRRSVRATGPGAQGTGRVITADGRWEPILDVDTSDRLRAKLGDPARRTNRGGRPAGYLLTGGIAVCGICGSPMRAQRHHGRRSMICSAEHYGRVRIGADPVEADVAAAVIVVADGGALAALLKRRANPELTRRLAGVEARVLELSDMYGSGELTREQFKRQNERLLADRDALAKRVDAERRVEGLDGLTDPLRDAWPTLALVRQRAVVKALVESVTIAPARAHGGRYDRDRLTITWKRAGS